MPPLSNDAAFSIALRSEVMSQRTGAIQQLIGSQLSDQASEMIDGVLADRDALVRRRAAELLRVLEYSSLVKGFLIRMADDPSWVVREAAVESIERHITPERTVLISVLVQCSLHDRRRVVRDTALSHVRDHLASFAHADSLFEEYVQAAKDRRFAVRCRAVEGLSALYELFPQGIDTLIECANESHYKVRRAVVMNAPQSGEHARRMIPVLVKQWFDHNLSIANAVRNVLHTQWQETDGLLGLCLEVVLKNTDPESRLGALLEIEELKIRQGGNLQKLCKRRSEWACRVRSPMIEPAGIADPRLDQRIQDTMKVVSSMSSRRPEKRQRQQQIWFIGQIFQLLSDNYVTEANPTD